VGDAGLYGDLEAVPLGVGGRDGGVSSHDVLPFCTVSLFDAGKAKAP
jgi:hypothetical protein